MTVFDYFINSSGDEIDVFIITTAVKKINSDCFVVQGINEFYIIDEVTKEVLFYSDKFRGYLNYVCSLLAGYVWALGYVFCPDLLETATQMPHIAAMAISELVLTFLLIFIHVKFLHGTVLNKVPAVFAGVATIFAAGGIHHTMLCAVSAVIGISMAVITEIIIVKLCEREQ